MLRLVLPDREGCAFRQALMADPETMRYNAPWFPPEGTIPFPEDAWDEWLDAWCGHEPERFCAFLAQEDGTLVGEVCWHHHGAGMGVIILAKYRGRGYGAQALQLLMDRAFTHPEIPFLENNFESERDAALRLHLRAGFIPSGTDPDGYLILRKYRA